MKNTKYFAKTILNTFIFSILILVIFRVTDTAWMDYIMKYGFSSLEWKLLILDFFPLFIFLSAIFLYRKGMLIDQEYSVIDALGLVSIGPILFSVTFLVIIKTMYLDVDNKALAIFFVFGNIACLIFSLILSLITFIQIKLNRKNNFVK